MDVKFFFLLLFLFFCSHVMAQDKTVSQEISTIDSLILYSRFDQADQHIDSLLQQLDRFVLRRKNKLNLLEIKYRKVVLEDRHSTISSDFFSTCKKLIDESIQYGAPSLTYRLYLMMALGYEKATDLKLTELYLDKAYEVYEGNNLESEFSTYCIRKSSLFRYQENWDSTAYYANAATEYATKYNNKTDLLDSYILLAAVAKANEDYDKALEFNYYLLDHSKSIYDTKSIAVRYLSIARIYTMAGEPERSLQYIDSLNNFFSKISFDNSTRYFYHLVLYQANEALGKVDVAYDEYKKYHTYYSMNRQEMMDLNTREIEEKFRNEKNLDRIKNKNLQIILSSSILFVFLGASFLLYRKNNFINHQNKIINTQLIQLTKVLEQKQMLLSELQHRVKNNLSHVISMLEIQKESVDFNNIEELLRSNQNRIHSMALLHKKISVSEDANFVDLNRYITELAKLVRDSYNEKDKEVELIIECEVEKISIEKTLPIGLIVVELVSNSMKHAFNKRTKGAIKIEFFNDPKRMIYTDNGSGHDFYKTNKKGLGQEIIKGLIDQLDGVVQTHDSVGFKLTIDFK